LLPYDDMHDVLTKQLKALYKWRGIHGCQRSGGAESKPSEEPDTPRGLQCACNDAEKGGAIKDLCIVIKLLERQLMQRLVAQVGHPEYDISYEIALLHFDPEQNNAVQLEKIVNGRRRNAKCPIVAAMRDEVDEITKEEDDGDDEVDGDSESLKNKIKD